MAGTVFRPSGLPRGTCARFFYGSIAASIRSSLMFAMNACDTRTW